MLDPDEMEGPASFMIQRLQRQDSSIRTDRPIPMSKLKEAFENMRGGRGGDDEDGDGEEDLISAAELVPGFGGLELPPPVPGFGASADLFAVRITPEDTLEAEETLERYDRNRNGFIDGDEVSRRLGGNIMDFDQNRDNRLSPQELAVRFARQRINREEEREQRDQRRNEAPVDTLKEIEIVDRFDGRRSYRPQRDSAPDGLPGWFPQRDQDGDGQVRMAEYAEEWTDELIEEFYRFDGNFDGVLTVDEVLAAVRTGATASTGTSSGGSGRDASQGRSGRGGWGERGEGRGGFGGDREGGRRGDAEPAAAAPANGGGGPIDPKIQATVERIVKRSDKDGNGVLTADEWRDIMIDISPADADRDGKITIDEYARWLQSKQ